MLYMKIIMESPQTVRETFVEAFSKQLSEMELLKSMYPSQDEIILSDDSVIENMKSFVSDTTFWIPNNLDFVLKLLIDDLKLEVYISLPSLYPNEEPDFYVRCNQLNRHQETRLNTELLEYFKTAFQNEVCLYTIISWLHDNIDAFRAKIDTIPEHKTSETEKSESNAFVRLWIFSHHILNKYKRDEIVRKSRDLNLTGFCMPGKPGIICIEGNDKDCMEWWKYIKTLNWKKITIRKTEQFERSNQLKEQKFMDFQEICFQNIKNGFSKFIEEHDLSVQYSEFLGL